ncbi:MAG TPA: hypothetical protein VM450_15110 [Thermomicrobiales bacterium]|jgi:hypothetical protein|nr:hypothetical protein [Thermomicrobiales bacterium]
MYLARFMYSIKPVDRERAMQLLELEVAAARQQGLEAWLLVPLTRPLGGAALHVDVVLPDLNRLETFREHGMGSADDTRTWLRELSALLLEPPSVELLRVVGEYGELGPE